MNESLNPSRYIKQDYSAEIAAWERQGNKVKAVENKYHKTKAQFSDRALNAKQRARQIEDQASKADVLDLGKWLDAKKGRANELAKALGCRPEYISQIKMFTRPCSKERMTEIKRVMKEISTKESEVKNNEKN